MRKISAFAFDFGHFFHFWCTSSCRGAVPTISLSCNFGRSYVCCGVWGW